MTEATAIHDRAARPEQRVRAAAVASLVLAIWVVVALLWQSPADAHPADATLVKVSRNGDDIAFDVQIPLNLLDEASGTDLSSHPDEAIALHATLLRDLFARSIAVTGVSGDEWPLHVDKLEPTAIGGVNQLHVVMTASPVYGDSPDSFVLTYRVITEQLTAHDVYVAGSTGDTTTDLLGVINHRHPTLAISLEHPAAVGLRAMIDRGIHHFRSGTDHIIFITLLAASTAFTYRTARARITALAIRSTAFTLGHSLSLSLAASGTLNPPSRLVETGIAVTVFVTAMHVARPCIPHRAETAIALLFGLIHGFGFSSTLGNLGLTGRALIVPTVGFNIGLEVAQLAADVVLSLPLWWLARRRWSNIGIAVPAMAVAGSWIIQRGLNTSNPLEPLVNVVVATPERLAFIIGLFAAASAGYAAQRRRRVAEDFESSYIALRESPR